MAGKTRDEIAEAYSSPPWWYDIRGFFILTFAYNSTINAQLRFFGTHIQNEHIEIACGTGTLLELVLRWRKWKHLPPARITAIDYAESMLAGAYKRFKNTPEVEIKHADAADLPYPDNYFDSASIANSIHSFPIDCVNRALKEAFRILKPDGTLAVNVLTYPRGPQPLKGIAERINTWGKKKGILATPYEVNDIRTRFIDAGFEIAEEFEAGNTYNVVARKPRK